MLAHATKPILCVAVIRLAPMHDAVKKIAVWIGNVLGDSVGRFEMIVPEQHQTANEFG